MSTGTAPHAAEPLLEIKNLSKTFGSRRMSVRAVNGVSLDVRPGETVAVVGETGCGKSTTARCVVRLIEPSSGQIIFRGRDITRMRAGEFRPLRRHIQMVFQDPHASLNPSMSVRQILREPLRLHNLAGSEDSEERLRELMALVHLDPALLNRRPDQLSGGQKQRVGIARALSTQPEFIVLDEPTSSLDVSLQVALLELLAELQQRLGMSYLFITHDFSTVRQIADRVVVMYLGKVMERGPVDDVLNDPKHPYTRALVSAIPIPDPRRRRRRTSLRGETPSATTELRGCPFQDRCPHVMDECSQDAIPLFAAGSRQVACLLFDGRHEAPVEPRRNDSAAQVGIDE
jgi:oligopeptide/dipeptide ABC transporter ATP-binding protein